MTQPKFAPILDVDEVRDSFRLPTPPPWGPHRPGDFRPAPGALGAGRGHRGSPGPDQGYALKLAEELESRVRLAEGEHGEDVTAGATAIAMRRAAMFGRAPVMADLQLALHLFGYLDGASEELIELRKPLFAGAAHDYDVVRSLVDGIPEATIRLTPGEVAARNDDWETLIGG